MTVPDLEKYLKGLLRLSLWFELEMVGGGEKSETMFIWIDIYIYAL